MPLRLLHKGPLPSGSRIYDSWWCPQRTHKLWKNPRARLPLWTTGYGAENETDGLRIPDFKRNVNGLNFAHSSSWLPRLRYTCVGNITWGQQVWFGPSVVSTSLHAKIANSQKSGSTVLSAKELISCHWDWDASRGVKNSLNISCI